MKRFQLIMIAALFILCPAAIFAQNSTPVAAVKSFYEYDRSHSQTFTWSAIEARRKWFTPELYKLFQKELKRERDFLKKHPKDKTYFGDGLPFQPIDETCGTGGKGKHKALTFKAEPVAGVTASVQAIFAFPKPCTEPDTTIYTVKLVKRPNGWLIDDVQFEGDRSLVPDLKRKDY